MCSAWLGLPLCCASLGLLIRSERCLEVVTLPFGNGASWLRASVPLGQDSEGGPRSRREERKSVLLCVRLGAGFEEGWVGVSFHFCREPRLCLF